LVVSIITIFTILSAFRNLLYPSKQESTTQQASFAQPPDFKPISKGEFESASLSVNEDSDREVLNSPDFLQANALLLHGKHEEALKQFEAVASRFQGNKLVVVKIAHVLSEKHSDHSIIQSNAQTVIDNPASADAWLCLADILNSKGFISEALIAYRKAVQIEPRFEIGWSALAVALDSGGQTEQAIEAYRQAIMINPHRTQSWNSLALALHKQGKISEAVSAFQQAIEKQAANANTWNNLGVSLMALGKEKEAVSAFKEAVKLEPTLAKAWNNLGVGLECTGMKDEATAAFLQAHQVSKN